MYDDLFLNRDLNCKHPLFTKHSTFWVQKKKINYDNGGKKQNKKPQNLKCTSRDKNDSQLWVQCGLFYVEFIQLRIGAVSVEEAIQMLSLSFTF